MQHACQLVSAPRIIRQDLIIKLKLPYPPRLSPGEAELAEAPCSNLTQASAHPAHGVNRIVALNMINIEKRPDSGRIPQQMAFKRPMSCGPPDQHGQTCLDMRWRVGADMPSGTPSPALFWSAYLLHQLCTCLLICQVCCCTLLHVASCSETICLS